MLVKSSLNRPLYRATFVAVLTIISAAQPARAIDLEKSWARIAPHCEILRDKSGICSPFLATFNRMLLAYVRETCKADNLSDDPILIQCFIYCRSILFSLIGFMAPIIRPENRFNYSKLYNIDVFIDASLVHLKTWLSDEGELPGNMRPFMRNMTDNRPVCYDALIAAQHST